MTDVRNDRRRAPLHGQLLIDAFSIACEHHGATDVQCHPMPGGRDILVQAAWPAPTGLCADVTCSIDLLCPASGGAPKALGPSFTLQPTGLLYHRAIRSGAVHGDQLANLIQGSAQSILEVTAMLNDLTATGISEEQTRKFLNNLFEQGLGMDVKQVVPTRQRNELIRLNSCFQQGFLNEGWNQLGMFAGVLRFTNQVAYCRGPRRAYLMAGKGHRLNTISFDLLSAQTKALMQRSLMHT
jgi:hypothetical protein